MGKNATRNDVAKLAGVSPAVVSYVINKTKFVSEEKTQAVLDAIKELNYQPNLYARSLKTNRSMQIAFVCDNLRNDWLEIAEKKLDKLGYNVSHCYSRDGDDFIQSLISGRYDAVFMLSNRYKAVQLNRIAEAGIPVVLYKTREYSHLEPNIVAVAPNLYSGVEKTVNYLVFRGHRRILFVRRCATICISPAATVSAATAMRWKSTASPMMSAMSAPMRTRWRVCCPMCLTWFSAKARTSAPLPLLRAMISSLHPSCST